MNARSQSAVEPAAIPMKTNEIAVEFVSADTVSHLTIEDATLLADEVVPLGNIKPVGSVADHGYEMEGSPDIVMPPPAEDERIAESEVDVALDEIEVMEEMDVIDIPMMPEGLQNDAELTSLSLDNVPVMDVINMFAKTIDEANIVMGTNSIQGTVSVNIRNVPWEDALNVILDSVGLAKVEKQGGIYTIVPKEQLDTAPMESMVYPVEYLAVAEIVKVAKELVSEGGAAFSAPGNTLVVRDRVERLPIILETLKHIDQPREQVYIEAKFVELSDEARENIGIDWSILEGYEVGLGGMSWSLKDSRKSERSNAAEMTRYDVQAKSSAQRNYYDVNGERTVLSSGDDYDIWPGADGSTIQSMSWDGGPQAWNNATEGKGQSVTDVAKDIYSKTVDDVRSAILSPAEFSLILSALRQNNGVKVVSNPKIVVLDEETASIHIGTKEPNIRVSKDTDSDTKTVTYTTELDKDMPYFDYGIKLDVTPTINTSNNITVMIEPALIRYLREKTAPDGNTFPIYSSKTIKTMFSVMSGRTVAIGGLAEVDNNDAETKVPLLGSIPVLGRLFSHTEKTHKQSETIIFVTVALANPTSIEETEGMPEETMLAKKYLIEDKTNDQLLDQELAILAGEEQQRFDAEMKKYKKYLDKLQNK